MKKFNILCCPDNNYTPYYGIMLTSLFENNKNTNICVYIVTAELNINNKQILKRLAGIYNQQIFIIELEDIKSTEYPVWRGDHISTAAYYRILAPTFLPKELDKILYLDGDIIVNNDITKLYNTNIDNYAIAAIIDEGYTDKDKYQRLNISNDGNYINSGVLLMNLKYWREHNLVYKSLAYIKENRDKIIQHDQDVINAVMHNEIKLLPITYNFQTGFLFSCFFPNFNQELKKEIKENLYNPIIIHYSGSVKPWHKYTQHPYTKQYMHYRKISLWKNFPIVDNWSFINKIRFYLLNIIWTIGIKKRPNSYIIRHI